MSADDREMVIPLAPGTSPLIVHTQCGACAVLAAQVQRLSAENERLRGHWPTWTEATPAEMADELLKHPLAVAQLKRGRGRVTTNRHWMT